MRFTVIGMGQTGCAAACYLMQKGYAVTCWDRNQEKLRHLAQRGIQISGELSGEFHPTVEADLSKSIAQSKYILIMTTAGAHRELAAQLRGALQKGQRIIVFNCNWGAYEFYSVLREEAAEKQVVIGETGGQIFMSVMQEMATPFLKAIKTHVALATIPASVCGELLLELRNAFPQLCAAQNVLETSLNNSNAMIHAPLNLFNLARVDSGRPYLMYATDQNGEEYTTPLAVRYIEQIDEERKAVMRAIGVKYLSVLDVLNSFWDGDYPNLYLALKEVKSYQTAKAPTSFENRHFTEDIPFGVIPIWKLAERYDVPTPYLEQLVNAYIYCVGINYQDLSPDFNQLDLAELKR